MQLFASGKRNHLVGDYQSAADCLSECCAIFGKYYGEAAIECGEPLLIYGKSLLELARIESGVIDDGVKGGEDRRECKSMALENEVALYLLDTSSCNGASEDEGEEAEGEDEDNALAEGSEQPEEKKTDEPYSKESTKMIGIGSNQINRWLLYYHVFFFSRF